MAFRFSVAAVSESFEDAMIPVAFDDEEEAEFCPEDTAATGFTTLGFHFSHSSIIDNPSTRQSRECICAISRTFYRLFRKFTSWPIIPKIFPE